MGTRFATGLLCLLTLTAAPTFAVERCVPQDVASVALALGLSAAGDTVTVSAGVYTEHDLDLPGGVTLRGAGEAAATVLDAGGFGRVIQAVDPDDITTRIRSLTFTGGDEEEGGALYAYQLTGLEIIDCIFADNTAMSGAGAGLHGCDEVRVEGCRFERNAADFVGGLVLQGGVDITISDCVFLDNTAVVSAGLELYMTQQARVERCLFVDNVSLDYPSHLTGGYLLDTLAVESCTFVGGGDCIMGLRYGTMTVANSIFVGGDGLWNDGTLTFTCCLFHDSWEAVIGSDGNRGGDPCFCDPDAGDYTLAADSNALANASPECGLIGAYGEGCGEMGCRLVVNEARSWGEVKSLYR